MEDLIWKKKNTSRKTYIMLFFIRLAEILIASIIPSIVGLVIVIITPTERVMMIMENMSLIVFGVMNSIFWVRYIKHRRKTLEFYVLNGTAYILYLIISILSYSSQDVYLYSTFFSNLRGMELHGLGTFASLVVSHGILLITMILCQIFARIYYTKKDEKSLVNSIGEAEYEIEYDVPTQGNGEVAFLTVDQLNREIDREIEEAAEMIEKEKSVDTSKTWDSEMVHGNGRRVVENTPDDPDNDIDASDYVSKEYAREEMKDTLNYSSDELWNTEIYNGKERIYDYDEYDDSTFSIEEKQRLKKEYDALWGDDDGFNIERRLDYDDENEGINGLEDYDSDNLWDNVKQGRQE